MASSMASAGRGVPFLSMLLACIACVACGHGVEGAPAEGGGGGGGGALGWNRGLDPSTYDCRAEGPPERRSPIPSSCVLDPTCQAKLVVGHRAAGGELGVFAPENSLAAVRAAVVMGAEFIETDPRATKDGVLVNHHDPEVDRTTNGTGELSAMTFDEVSKLALESAKYPGEFGCERVPTIEEVLLEAKGRAFVLLDANKTNRVDLLVLAVQKTETLEWAIFDTDDVGKIDEALALEPKLRTMIRVASQDELAFELEHFAAHPPVVVEVDSAPGYEALAESARASGLRTMVNVFGLDLAAGLGDDSSVYGSVFDGPIDLAQTDRPDLVLRHLGRFAGTSEP